MVARTRLNVELYAHRLSCTTITPPKSRLLVFFVKRMALNGRPKRKLNGQSTFGASRQHIAAVLGLSPPDVFRKQHPCQPARPVTLLLLLLLLLLLFLV